MNQKSGLLILGENTERDNLDFDKYDLVVTMELNSEKFLNSQNIRCIYFHRHAQSKNTWEKIVSSSKKLLEEFPYQIMGHKKSLFELLKYEDTSLWWFVYDSIMESKNGFFEIIYYFKTLLSFIENEKPKNIEIRGTVSPLIIKILNILQEKYHFKIDDMRYDPNNIKKIERTIVRKEVKLLLKFFFSKITDTNSYGNKKLAIFFRHGNSSIIRKRGKQKIIVDHYVKELDSFLFQNKKNMIFFSYNTPERKKSFLHNLLLEFIETIIGTYHPWVGTYEFNDLKLFKKTSQEYKQTVIKFFDDENSQEYLVDEINIMSLMKPVLIDKLPKLLAYVKTELIVTKRFLENFNGSILSMDLFTPYGKALTFNANKMGRKIYSPQGGIISSQIALNWCFFINKNFDSRLLPKLFVWGPFYERILLERGFPSGHIKQVGFWHKADNGTCSPKPFMLFVTGANTNKLEFVTSIEEEIFTIRKIAECIPNEMKLVVKIHPSLSKERYEKELKAKNISIAEKTADINLLISEAKIVIGKQSTVIINAFVNNKPIIIANFASDLDFLGIEKIPFATSPEMFKEYLFEIIENNYQVSRNIKKIIAPLEKESVEIITKELEG